MKKGNFILSVLLAFALCSFNTSCNITSADANPALLKRTDTSASAEFGDIQQLYTRYKLAIEQDSNDDLSKLKLVELFINEARVTGNLSHYNHAALQLLIPLTNKKTISGDILYQALAYQATVYLSLHQFVEAKRVAQQAVKINPYDADIYGALCDANVELGLYEEAVTMCDKMMSIRPDIRSYSRVSYIRQIFGDNQGAISAMRMAVESGAQGMENTEWARVQLGDLYLNTGHADTARMLYESSLYARPSYPFAEMGMARMFSKQKQYDSAIAHCKNAIRIMSESAFISYLGELYQLKGESDKAREVHRDVLDLMLENEQENQQEKLAKHNGNRELANAYLQTRQFEQALSYAKEDLAMRPDNIDANELLAWICFQKNDLVSAKIHIEKALKTKTQSAALLYKASLIYATCGDDQKAVALKSKSMEIDNTLSSAHFVAVHKKM